MSDLPSVFSDRIRTARREHKCCECHQSIAPGSRYHLSKGYWDGKWAEFKTCVDCDDLRDEILRDCHFDEIPAFGELLEWDRDGGYRERKEGV